MAPVGSYESLAAAIQAGADAVYFGVGKLNMRSASAANFTLDDLSKIVATARGAGVKSYLTVNTVVYEDEIAEVHAVIDRAKAAGVDAVIASDLAAILYARRIGQEGTSPPSATSRTPRRCGSSPNGPTRWSWRAN